jgi:hypothetical protein
MPAWKTIAVALLLLLAAPASGARAENAIDCSGVFGRDTSHEALVKAFGAENVVYKKIDAPQPSCSSATANGDFWSNGATKRSAHGQSISASMAARNGLHRSESRLAP